MEYLKFLDPQTKESRAFSDKIKSFSFESETNAYCIPGLYSCYAKPSNIKADIYSRCIDFCQKYVKELNAIGWDCGIKDYGIISYNCNFFTFACVVGVYATSPKIAGQWLYDKAIIITPSKMFEIIL